MYRIYLCRLYLFSLVLLTITSLLNASQSCIPINKIPVVINKSGYYCLEKNHYYSGNQNPITINTSYVTLDFKSYKIELIPHNSANQIYGVYSLNSHHIIVKNGRIKGFMMAIYLADSRGSKTSEGSHSGHYLIEKMTLQNNFFRGVRLEGVKQKINNCRILNTGGSTVYENAFSMGIEMIGPYSIVENNFIQDTKASGEGENIGISFSNNNANSVATGNHIFNHYGFLEKRAHFRGDSGHSFGIWVGGNEKYRSNVLVHDNWIKNMYYGIVFSSVTRGKVKNNEIESADKALLINSSVVVF
ncbi:TPA: hypothetical protein GDD11_14910 [Legionella pneumophila]|nr:hypothetical protein [Legionella pneumophila]HAT8333178.1 hypothetical protein [Legionella pneumophila]HCJ4395498.1 hypothetical protein [Legionella pneumophila]